MSAITQVTDDERREVASNLRLLDPSVFDAGELYDSWEVLDALGVAIDDSGWCESACVQRLADLVEPSCNRDALLELADAMDNEADDAADAAREARLPGRLPMAGKAWRGDRGRHREEAADRAERDALKWRTAARIVRLACGEEGR